MKKFYLIVLTSFFFSFSFAGAPTIKGTTNNGAWRSSNTWDKNRVPQNGDTIVIPSGKTIILNNQQDLDNVYIKVFGVLKFSGFLSYLNLNNLSTVAVYNGGSIQSTMDFWQYIFLGGQTIFSSGDVLGPKLADASSGGFSNFTPLPVKFVGFTVTRKNNDVMIQWSTSQEISADMYQVERSFDGANWSTIAYVAASGNSSNVNNYSFSDKNVTAKITYYRIKEVDLGGKFVYTPIKSIRTEAGSRVDIKIASVSSKVLLEFPQEVKGNLVVRFVSLSGQVVDQQTITNAMGQVILNSKVSGNYIISVSNGQDINVAKQIIL
jgi:hypothetical protein